MASVRPPRALRSCSSLLAIACVLGCPKDEPEDGSSSTGEGEPRATVLVPVGGNFCDDPLVVGVQVRALRIGCEHPPPSPCTLPAEPEHVLGDEASCPITETMELGVVVHEAGEYQIDVVADRTPDAPTTECFAESNQQTSMLVTSVDIDIRAVRTGLVGLGQPCPDP